MNKSNSEQLKYNAGHVQCGCMDTQEIILNMMETELYVSSHKFHKKKKRDFSRSEMLNCETSSEL